MLMALNNAFASRSLTTDEGSEAIGLLEGHLETALHILKRWRVDERSRQDDDPQEKGTADDGSL
jgi:hypothetical protein